MTEEWIIENLKYLKGFCFRTKRAIDQALEAIGMTVDFQLLLLFPLEGGGSVSRFTGVTMSGPLPDDDIAEIASSVADMENQDHGQQITHSNPQLNDMRGWLEFQMRRADAISRALETSPQFEGLSFFASARAPIHGHEAHTCVGIKTAELGRFPALEGPVVDRVHVGRSLQHEVIDECLRRADRSLYTWDPNSQEGPPGVAGGREQDRRIGAGRRVDATSLGDPRRLVLQNRGHHISPLREIGGQRAPCHRQQREARDQAEQCN